MPLRAARSSILLRLVSVSLVLAAVLGATLARPAAAQSVDTNFWVTDGVINATARLGDTLYLGGNFQYCGPNTGSGVPLTLATGQPLANAPRVDGLVLAAIPDGAGGWYLGGQFSKIGGLTRSHLAHLRSDMSVDSWDPAPDGAVLSLALSDGRVLVGGTFANIGGAARANLAAVDPLTGVATAWAPDADAAVQAIVVDSTRVLVGGQFLNVGGATRRRLAALDATTGAALAWNPDVNGPVQALVLDGGVVYVGGGFTTVGGLARTNLAAVDAAIGSTLSWRCNTNGFVQALAARDGNLYAGGSFKVIGGQFRSYLAAIDEASAIPTAWDPEPDNAVATLLVQDSNVFAGGSFTTVGGLTRRNLAAIDIDTAIPASWTSDASANVRTLATDGTTLFAGGDFASIGGVARHHLAALDLTTGAATSWNPNANNFVQALAIANGVVYIGGGFTKMTNVPRNALAAVDAMTGALSPWNPGANGFVYALVVTGGKVYAAGGFTTIGGQTRRNLAALDVVTSLPTAWSPNPNDFVYALALSGNTLYVGGQFNSISATVRSRAAAYDITTTALLPWDPNADGTVHTLAPNGATIFAGGGFTNIGGQPHAHLAQLDATSGAATAWAGSTDEFVQMILLDFGTLYAAGDFTQAGGQPRQHVAALDVGTGSALAWDPSTNNFAQSIARAGSRVFTGGFFSSVGGTTVQGVAALTPAAYPPPTATLTAPLGGELWIAGTTHDITWTASGSSGIASIDLALSSDGGASYPTTIATGLPNTGVYHWNVTDLPSAQSRVRVTAHDFASLTATDASPADFAIERWTITATAGPDGSIAPSGVTTIANGGNRAFTITPAAHHHVLDVLVDGVSVGAVTAYTFTNVTSDHTIAASFAIDTYTITASAGANGSVDPSGAVVVPYSEDRTFTFTPAAHYHVADVLVDGASVGAVVSYTFHTVAANHTVAVSFALDAFTITASAGPNGSVSPSGAVSVLYGGSQAFAITAAVNHHVADVLVDGVSVGAVTTYTFTDVDADHSLAASFAIDPTVIRALPPAFALSNGHPTVSVPVALTGVNPSPVKAFSVTVQVGGVTTLANGVASITEGTFMSSAGETYFHVTDADSGRYIVDCAVLGPSCGSTLPNGTLFQLELATADTVGSGLVSVTAIRLRDCTNQTIPFAAGPPATVPLDFVAPDVAISAPVGGESWLLGSVHAVAWSASDASGISAIDLALSSDGGATYPTTLATGLPNSGSFAWTVAGPLGTTARVRVVAHDGNGNVASAASPADFAIVPITITASAGGHGSITPSGAVLVAYDSSPSFTFTSDPGYRVASVLVDGAPVATAPSYTFSHVTVDHTIAVSFADSAAPLVHVLAPNGGEHRVANTSQHIQWSASDNTGVTAIDILLSRTGAAGVFDTLATGLPNDGDWTWFVTGPPTTQAVVRVVAHDADDNTGADVSDAVFAILATSGVDDAPVTAFALGAPRPNPVRGAGSIGFALPTAATVHLALIDVQGREAVVLADGAYAAGRHLVSLSAAGLEPGVYFARLQTAGRTFTQRIAIVR